MLVPALAFAGVALGLVVGAAILGGLAWVLVWPGLAFLVVAVAYATGDARLFGKTSHPALRTVLRVVLLPYLGLAAFVWHILRLFDRRPAYAWLASDLCVGRRLLPDEYPPAIASIADLTCEFTERLPRNRQVEYRTFPILDGGTVREDALRAMASEIAKLPRPVYLHCAQGHGRSAMVGAALLLDLGLAATPEQAVAKIRAARPGGSMTRRQRAVVEQIRRREPG